jgi:hypothetical protein
MPDFDGQVARWSLSGAQLGAFWLGFENRSLAGVTIARKRQDAASMHKG